MIDKFQQKSNRRSMISRGSALIGAYLVGAAITPAEAQTSNVNNDDPIDMKSGC